MNSDIQKEKNRQFVFLKMLSLALSNNNFSDLKSSMFDFVKNNKIDLNLLQKDNKPFWFNYLDNPIKRDFFETMGINFDQKIELTGTQFPSQQSNIVIATFAEIKNSNKYHKLPFYFMNKYPHLIGEPVISRHQKKVSTFYAICYEEFTTPDKYHALLEQVIKNPLLVKQCRNEQLNSFFANHIFLNFVDSIKIPISIPAYTKSHFAVQPEIENKQFSFIENNFLEAQKKYETIFDEPYPKISYETLISQRQGLRFHELHKLVCYLDNKDIIFLNEIDVDKTKQSLFNIKQNHNNLPLLSRNLKVTGDSSDNFVECGLHFLDLAKSSLDLLLDKYSIDAGNEYKDLLNQILDSVQTTSATIGGRMSFQKIIDTYGTEHQKSRLENKLLHQRNSARKFLKTL